MKKLYLSTVLIFLVMCCLTITRVNATTIDETVQQAVSIEDETVAPMQVANSSSTSTPYPTDQIIVKYIDAISASEAGRGSRMALLSDVAGVPLTYFREMSGDAHVIKLPEKLPVAEVYAVAAQIATLPDVEYAEPDLIMWPTRIPNDARLSEQYGLIGTYGIQALSAWDITTGDSDVVIAVLDTGTVDHHDLSGRIIGGYDFISDSFTANDGGGRDSDYSDPGDWVTAGQCGGGKPEHDENSSWHGTHVAGTIGAATNNSFGVAGVNWVSPMLSVRVLGRCGGTISDIADAIRWSAGIAVSGVPNNPNPADIINMSLGGPSASCSPDYQNAIYDAENAGALVIVAAGNRNIDASGYSPANCLRVLTVGGTNSDGDRYTNSNFGSTVKVSAPGVSVISTDNAGTQGPSQHVYAYKTGTSMATPHVAGVASLIKSLRPTLSPADVKVVIFDSTTPFKNGSTCNTTLCGSGIVNAYKAVHELYADANAGSYEIGTRSHPYNTINEINTEAWDGVHVTIQGGNYPETVTISKQMTLTAENGVVTIGE